MPGESMARGAPAEAAGVAGCAPEPQLRHFRAFKEGAVTVYSIQLSSGDKDWTTLRRYSEFLQCHVQLLETFQREELPPFPPKEPLLRKVFRRDDGKPSEWTEERKVLLYHYLSGLLEKPGTARTPALLRFLGLMENAEEAAAADAGEGAVDTPLARDKLVRFQAAALGGRLHGVGQRLFEEGGEVPHTEEVGAVTVELDLKDATGRANAAAGDMHTGAATNANIAPDCAPEDYNHPVVESMGLGHSPPKELGPNVRGVLRGPTVHKIISFQGSAAAAYARKVEESQRLAMERAPQRFEKQEDGSARSVPMKFSMVGRLPVDDLEERANRSADELDTSREQQRSQQLRDEERRVAQWIHAVTGDPGADAVAAGSCTLYAALQSGEALCDLVNAIWPGRIVGIRRGQTDSASPRSSRRRLANATHFVQACVELGVEGSNMLLPSDLAEGKGLRSVVRCIFALGALTPEPPDFDGPRLMPVTKAALASVALKSKESLQDDEEP